MTMLDSGPMGPTNDALRDILVELYDLNLSIRQLVSKESSETPPPVIQVTSPDVDLTPLAEALSQPQTPDLTPLLAALAETRGGDDSTDLAILEALQQLRKELGDLGVGMRAIAGQSIGGGGAVYLANDQVFTVTGALTDAELRASAVTVKDDYSDGEILDDQAGAGAVLTFTFSSPVNTIWVTDTGSTTSNVSRADPFGGTPSSTLGIPVFNQTPTPISVVTSSIKVYAPAGANISVYGYRR